MRYQLRICRAVVTLCSLGMLATTASQTLDTDYPPPPGPYRVGPVEAKPAPVAPPVAAPPTRQWRVPDDDDAPTLFGAQGAATPIPLADERPQPPPSRRPAFVERRSDAEPPATTARPPHDGAPTTADRPRGPMRATQPAATESVFRPAGTPPY